MIKFSAEYDLDANVACEDGEIIIPPHFNEAQTPNNWPEDTANETNDYEALRFEHEGASLSIAVRALAIESTMKSLNTMNGKHAFAHAAYTEPSDKAIYRRYGHNTDGVVEGALRKADQASFDFENGLSILTGPDEDYLRAGFTQKEVDVMKRQMRTELLAAYGIGNAYAKDRNAVIKRANKTAANISRPKM